MSQVYTIYINSKEIKLPIEDARDLLAMQAGFDDYEDMKAQGCKFGNKLDNL